MYHFPEVIVTYRSGSLADCDALFGIFNVVLEGWKPNLASSGQKM